MPIDQDAYAIACSAVDLAAFDAAHWHKAVDHLARATGSRAAELVGINPQSAVPLHIVADANLDPAALLRDWHAVGGATPAINPMIRAGLSSPAMHLLLDHQLVSIDGRARHVLWNEVFDPFDVPHLGSIIVHRDGPEYLVASVLRSRGQGPLEGEARAMLEAFAARMQASVALSRSFGLEAARLLTSALEAVDTAAVALSGWGRVVGVTEAAAGLIAGTGCLRVDGADLRARDGATDRQLRTAVASAHGGASGELSVAYRPGRRLRISTHPLRGAIRLGFSARVLVTLRDEPAIDHLTPAERAVLDHLIAGTSIGDIADIRGVSRDTVKTQAKVIYSKLNVSRHVDLMRIFAG